MKGKKRNIREMVLSRIRDLVTQMVEMATNKSNKQFQDIPIHICSQPSDMHHRYAMGRIFKILSRPFAAERRKASIFLLAYRSPSTEGPTTSCDRFSHSLIDLRIGG